MEKKVSKLSTTDVPDVGTGGIKKVIQPGNVVIRINDITFDKTPFTDESWNLNLHVETEPFTDKDFDGFWIDKKDESKGKYLGQVARVRAGEYAFKDGTIGNTAITRDQEVLKFLKSLTTAIGAPKWFTDQNNKHDTVEELIGQLKKDKPYKDIWLNACLAGKSYITKENFVI